MRLSLPDLAAAYMAAWMAKTRRACGTFAAVSDILLLVYRLAACSDFRADAFQGPSLVATRPA
jgi:hypothetical protein